MKIKQGYYVDMNDTLIIVYNDGWEFYFDFEELWSGKAQFSSWTIKFYKDLKWEFIDELY